MSIRILQEAFMADFAAMTLTGYTKVYPNLSFSGQKPYTSLQFVHTEALSYTMANTNQVYSGFCLFTVVTELARGLEQAGLAAELICARYPFAKIISATGGRIEISSPPMTMEGFRQDNDWRTPVRVPYRAIF